MSNVTDLRKNNSKLAELIEKRDNLLKENPKLEELQFKINDTLAGAGTQQNRLLLINKLMIDSLRDLQAKNEDIANDLATLSSKCTNATITLNKVIKEITNG